MLLDRAEAYDPDLDGISLFQLYCDFAKQAFWFRQILFWFVTPKSKFLSAVVPFDNMVRGVHRNNVNKATDRNISRTQSLSRDVVSVSVTLSYFTFVNESYLSIASVSQTLSNYHISLSVRSTFSPRFPSTTKSLLDFVWRSKGLNSKQALWLIKFLTIKSNYRMNKIYK